MDRVLVHGRDENIDDWLDARRENLDESLHNSDNRANEVVPPGSPILFVILCACCTKLYQERLIANQELFNKEMVHELRISKVVIDEHTVHHSE